MSLKVEEKPKRNQHVSRRTLLTSLGAAGIAAAAGGLLYGSSVYSEEGTVQGSVYGKPGRGPASAEPHVIATTIAELRGDAHQRSNIVYYVMDRGQEGYFYYDPGNTVSSDNTGTVLVSTSGRRYHRIIEGAVLPAWFGAKGDGVADDAAALEAAMNYAISAGGLTVFLPAGTYLMSFGLDLTGSFNLLGEGESSVLLSTDINKSVLRVIGAVGSVFRDFKSLSTATARNSRQYGFRQEGCMRTLTDNVHIENCASAGIYIVNCQECQVTNCHVRNNFADGIHVTEKSKRIIIANNITDNTGDDAIAVVSYQKDGDYCENITIEGNQVYRSRSRGITHVGGKMVTIQNNIIDMTRSSGIMVAKDNSYNTYEPHLSIVKGNLIRSAGQYESGVGNRFGIEIPASAVDCEVSHNKVFHSFGRGIDVLGARRHILYNEVYQAGNSGLEIKNVTDSIVIGNSARECAKTGIYNESVTNTIYQANRCLNNNTGAFAGLANMTFKSCSFCIVESTLSVDNRVDPLVDTLLRIADCTELKFSNVTLIGAVTGRRFAGTTNAIEWNDIQTTIDVPATTIWKEGSEYIDTVHNRIYKYVSGVWKFVELTS